MARRPSSRPILCAVLDAQALGAGPHAFARGLFESGVDWIQLRDRTLSAESLFRVARLLVEARGEANHGDPASKVGDDDDAGMRRRVIVNRRIDVARSAGADGAHLGFDALDEGEARRLLPADATIGCSLHSLAEVEAHANLAIGGQRYAHLAPIWDPISKKASRPPLGLDLLERACTFGLPILAQGGIDAARAAEAVAVGASGIAVTGILSGAGNPMAVARQLRQALDEQSGQERDQARDRPPGRSLDGHFLPEG
jgi:thiamine-phosphate diphosphorylase